MQCHLTLVHEQKHEYLDFIEERNNQQTICKLCYNSFIHRENCIEHVRNVHQLGPIIVCQICEKSFHTNIKLRQHIKKEHDKKTVKCTVCNMSFSVKRKLGDHMFQAHKIGKKHMCETCGKYFPVPALLKLHNVRLHGSEEDKIAARNKYKCAECGKGFFTNGRLSDHKATHLKEMPFHCDQCPRHYSSIQNLNNHVKINHLGLLQLTDEQRKRFNARKKKYLADKKIKNGGEYRTSEERVVYNEYMKNRARGIRESQKKM